jgi:hypothetical protein
MDHNVPAAITVGLRLRSVDVVTAYEDSHHRVGDAQLLDRAQLLGRGLFSQDDDLVAEAVLRQREGREFLGVIYAHQLRVAIGVVIDDLYLIATAGDPDDLANTVQFLPL